jgi:hypothetical protein
MPAVFSQSISNMLHDITLTLKSPYPLVHSWLEVIPVTSDDYNHIR